MSQRFLMNTVIAVAFVGSLVLEHYGIIPVGTSTYIQGALTGALVGSGSAVVISGEKVFKSPTGPIVDSTPPAELP